MRTRTARKSLMVRREVIEAHVLSPFSRLYIGSMMKALVLGRSHDLTMV